MADLSELSDFELDRLIRKKAVETVESGGNPNAVSPKGAKGRMQVMDATNTDPGYGVRPATNNSPAERERVGTDYLDRMVQIFGPEKGLAAYNGGPGRMQRVGDISKMPPESQNYVKSVNALMAVPNANPPSNLGSLSDEDLDKLIAAQEKPVVQPVASPAPKSKPSRQEVMQALTEPGFSERFAKGGVDTLKNMAVGGNQFLWDAIAKATGNKYAQEQVTKMGQMASPGPQGIPEALGNAVNSAMVLPNLPAGTAPTLFGRMVQGGAAGAATAGMLPVQGEDFTNAKLNQMGMGGAFGAGGALAGDVLGRAVRGVTDSNVLSLLKQGVTPTFGQILGGATGRMEDKMRSVPGIGDAITAGQRRAIKEFDQAAYNNALEPIGKKAGREVGGAGIADVRQKIQDTYSDVLDNTQWQADYHTMVDMARGVMKATGQKPHISVKNGQWDLTQNNPNGAKRGLPEKQLNEFNDFLQENVLDKMRANGTMAGNTFKEIDSDLTRRIELYRSSRDVSDRNAGTALAEIRNALRGSWDRSNPSKVGQLDAADEAYARFSRLREAGSKVTGAWGDEVFTPGQLQQAIKAGDKSIGKGKFAERSALMQELSDPAMKVLSQKYPDSGTAGRGLLGALVGGAAVIKPETLAASGLGSLAYTPQGQRGIAALLARRPEFMRAIGGEMQQASPLVGAGLSGMFMQPNQ